MTGQLRGNKNWQPYGSPALCNGPSTPVLQPWWNLPNNLLSQCLKPPAAEAQTPLWGSIRSYIRGHNNQGKEANIVRAARTSPLRAFDEEGYPIICPGYKAGYCNGDNHLCPLAHVILTRRAL